MVNINILLFIFSSKSIKELLMNKSSNFKSFTPNNTSVLILRSQNNLVKTRDKIL